MRCNICGTEGNSRFCPNCGSPMAEVPPPQQPPIPQASSAIPLRPAAPPKHTAIKVIAIVLGSVFGFILLMVAIFFSVFTVFSKAEASAASSVKAPAEVVSKPERTASSEEESFFQIDQTINLKHWEITLEDMDVTDTVDASYGHYSADEGSRYIVLTVTVKNTGKDIDKFLPSFSFARDVDAKILYDEDYTYTASTFYGAGDDLHDTSLNPLEKQTGIIVFSVPENVADSKNQLLLQFSLGLDDATYTLR